MFRHWSLIDSAPAQLAASASRTRRVTLFGTTKTGLVTRLGASNHPMRTNLESVFLIKLKNTGPLSVVPYQHSCVPHNLSYSVSVLCKTRSCHLRYSRSVGCARINEVTVLLMTIYTRLGLDMEMSNNTIFGF